MEAGGGQPLSVSGSVHTAWTGTVALEVRPVKEGDASVIKRIHTWYVGCTRVLVLMVFYRTVKLSNQRKDSIS